MIPKNNSNLGS
jgi:hypothetical protein